MKEIIPIDEKSRIVIESQNYILQYRRISRNPKKCPAWRTDGYFATLTHLAEEYLNSSPRRADNSITSISEIVVIIKKAEARICELINNNNKNL